MNNNNIPLKSIILEETYDPNYQPTQQEIDEYAEFLGMDLERDKEFLWIAVEGLKAPLPNQWKPCKTEDDGDIYYFNFTNGTSTWEHPCDEYYRTMFTNEKLKRSQNHQQREMEISTTTLDQKKEKDMKWASSSKPQSKLDLVKPSSSLIEKSEVEAIKIQQPKLGPLKSLRNDQLFKPFPEKVENEPETSLKFPQTEKKKNESTALKSLSFQQQKSKWLEHRYEQWELEKKMIEEEHIRRMEKLRNVYENEEQNEKSSWDIKQNSRREFWKQQEIAETNEYEKKLKEIRLENNQKLQRESEALKNEFHREMDERLNARKQHIESTSSEHLKQLSDMKNENMKQIQRCKEQYEEETTMIENLHKIQLAEQKSIFNREIQTLEQEQVSILKNEKEKFSKQKLDLELIKIELKESEVTLNKKQQEMNQMKSELELRQNCLDQLNVKITNHQQIVNEFEQRVSKLNETIERLELRQSLENENLQKLVKQKETVELQLNDVMIKLKKSENEILIHENTKTKLENEIENSKSTNGNNEEMKTKLIALQLKYDQLENEFEMIKSTKENDLQILNVKSNEQLQEICNLKDKLQKFEANNLDFVHKSLFEELQTQNIHLQNELLWMRSRINELEIIKNDQKVLKTEFLPNLDTEKGKNDKKKQEIDLNSSQRVFKTELLPNLETQKVKNDQSKHEIELNSSQKVFKTEILPNFETEKVKNDEFDSDSQMDETFDDESSDLSILDVNLNEYRETKNEYHHKLVKQAKMYTIQQKRRLIELKMEMEQKILKWRLMVPQQWINIEELRKCIKQLNEEIVSYRILKQWVDCQLGNQSKSGGEKYFKYFENYKPKVANDDFKFKLKSLSNEKYSLNSHVHWLHAFRSEIKRANNSLQIPQSKYEKHNHPNDITIRIQIDPKTG